MWRFLKVPRLLRCNALQKNLQIYQKFSKKSKQSCLKPFLHTWVSGIWSITSSHHFLCRIIPSLSGPFIHALVDKCFLGLNDFFLIIKALDAQLATNGKNSATDDMCTSEWLHSQVLLWRPLHLNYNFSLWRQPSQIALFSDFRAIWM